MPHILSAGIPVLDEVYIVCESSVPEAKVEPSEFVTDWPRPVLWRVRADVHALSAGGRTRPSRLGRL
jgi:hypothetical protein